MDIKTIASESLPVSGIFLNLFAFSGMDRWIDGELTNCYLQERAAVKHNEEDEKLEEKTVEEEKKMKAVEEAEAPPQKRTESSSSKGKDNIGVQLDLEKLQRGDNNSKLHQHHHPLLKSNNEEHPEKASKLACCLSQTLLLLHLHGFLFLIYLCFPRLPPAQINRVPSLCPRCRWLAGLVLLLLGFLQWGTVRLIYCTF